MKIQLLSDTHGSPYALHSKADVIAHAGDFGNGLAAMRQFQAACMVRNAHCYLKITPYRYSRNTPCPTPPPTPSHPNIPTTALYPSACSPTGPSRATTRPVNPSMLWCTARSPKTGRDALPQAAESALRPLPDGRHRWPIRTTRCIACRKVQAAFATCPQPCSLP